MKRRDFVKSAGVGLARHGRRHAGHRAKFTGNHLAPDLELPKVARHHSTAAPRFLPRQVAELTDNQFQDPDVFAAGEIVPGCRRSTPRRTAPSRWRTQSSYYYVGKDPTFAIGTALPFGLNARQQNAWLYQGGGNDLLNEFYTKYNSTACRAATPARRWAAGSARRSRPPPISTD